MSVVEPVFSNIGTNKGLNRFSLRGKEKVQGQWRLYSLVHNIEKIMRYGVLLDSKALIAPIYDYRADILCKAIVIEL